MTAGCLVLGQAGNLGIILRSYEPAYIECGSTMQQYTPRDRCAELLAAIPAEVAPAIRWGPGGRRLPYFWQLQGWFPSPFSATFDYVIFGGKLADIR